MHLQCIAFIAVLKHAKTLVEAMSSRLSGTTLPTRCENSNPYMEAKLYHNLTGSASKTQYGLELEDLQYRRPQNYDDDYWRWKRGADNSNPDRPRKSKRNQIFATCCCGSVWVVIAWVVAIVILVGGITTLAVKLSVCDPQFLCLISSQQSVIDCST